MSLIALIGLLVVCGLGLWALNTFCAEFLDAKVLKLVNTLVYVVLVIICVLWVLRLLGVPTGLPDLRVQ